MAELNVKLLRFAIEQAERALREDAKRSDQRAKVEHEIAEKCGLDHLDSELRTALDESAFARGLACGLGYGANALADLLSALEDA